MLTRHRSTSALRFFFPLKFFPAAAIASHCGTPAARATDEIQAYNAERAPTGVFTIQQHLNYVWSGSTTADFPRGFASNRTLNGTPAFAYGVTDGNEAGSCIPFAFTSDGTFLPGKGRQLCTSP
jgi:hypothetical protein